MKPEDLIIESIDTRPKGGQHVGIPHTGIKITHIPTKLSAYCEFERSQLKNRSIAYDMLEYGLLEIGWIDP